MSAKKTIITIGDGIAAWCLHHKIQNQAEYQIKNISFNSEIPQCSKSTTSLNCLRGTRAGLTELGEKIRESYFLFEEFNEKHAPSGVALGVEHSLWPFENDDKWRRRYKEFGTSKDSEFVTSLIESEQSYTPNPAYFIDPIALESWFKENTVNVDYVNSFVTLIEKSEEKYIVKTSDGKEHIADKVIVCTNHAAMKLAHGFNEKVDYYLDHCKPVAGSYLQIDINDFDFKIETSESFNIAFESKHFIYRKEAGIVQIGSTSENRSDSLVPQKEKLRAIYDYVNENTTFDLPDFEAFTMHAGIRHKGFERKPKWGSVDGSGLFMICGLYRNAFTFSFLAAEDISKQVN